jgi:hypothetical protein
MRDGCAVDVGVVHCLSAVSVSFSGFSLFQVTYVSELLT